MGVPFYRKERPLGTGYGKDAAFSFYRESERGDYQSEREARSVGEKPLPLPLVAFEPYVLRHTDLTRMSPHCNAFTLARIAGHSSITITQRCRHPQADAVEAAFSKFGEREQLAEPRIHSLPLKEENLQRWPD